MYLAINTWYKQIYTYLSQSELMPKIHVLCRNNANNERKLPCRFSLNTALGLMKSQFDLIPASKLGL